MSAIASVLCSHVLSITRDDRVSPLWATLKRSAIPYLRSLFRLLRDVRRGVEVMVEVAGRAKGNEESSVQRLEM